MESFLQGQVISAKLQIVFKLMLTLYTFDEYGHEVSNILQDLHGSNDK